MIKLDVKIGDLLCQYWKGQPVRYFFIIDVYDVNLFLASTLGEPETFDKPEIIDVDIDSRQTNIEFKVL